MKIIIEKELEAWWVTSEDARGLSDKEIVELVNEDVCALLDDATWAVVREEGERYREGKCTIKS